MPKIQRYAGTAVTDRNRVPIRNELTSQLTRWKGICGNMMRVDYSAARFANRLKLMAPGEFFLSRPKSPIFASICRNLPYHFRRFALPKEYWSRRPSRNRLWEARDIVTGDSVNLWRTKGEHPERYFPDNSVKQGAFTEAHELR